MILSDMKKYILFALGILMISCTENDIEKGYEPVLVSFQKPSNFPDLVYNLDANPLTEDGIALGKALFYEGNLSSNGAIACAFCHEQASAFTHHGHTLSHGVNGNIGFRNAQPIQNLGFQNAFTWDGASSHLDLQPIIPITSDLEMGETLSNIIGKLQADQGYRNMFSKAFEDGEITSSHLLQALSQFMVTMVSSNSKYDKVERNEGAVYTTIEADGLASFNQKCTSCHAGSLQTDQSYRNNGLAVNPRLNDLGRYNLLEIPQDLYKFKVPSLRNVAVTFPYMHDGRLSDLESVLDHYASGMVDTGTIDPSLVKADGSLGIDLTTYEKESTIAFLETLTDQEFLNDERFAEF